MDHAEMVTLIRGGVAGSSGVWADMGAGSGNFTYALRDLLGPQATIYAVDRDGKAFAAQQARMAQAGSGAPIIPRQADFTHPLTFPPLDGILMANALHFVRDQSAVVSLLARYLKPGGRLLLVEYAVRDVLRYVPYPVPFERFTALAAEAHLTSPALVGTRRSPSTGMEMYAAVATATQHNTPE